MITPPSCGNRGAAQVPASVPGRKDTQMDYNTKTSKSIMLMTSFKGRPAPGGTFNEGTGRYTKVCKDPAAGQHPAILAFGGIDNDILEALKRRGCRTMTLKLGDGTTYHTTFKAFVENAVCVKWKDPRYPPGGRWYLDGKFWTVNS